MRNIIFQLLFLFCLLLLCPLHLLLVINAHFLLFCIKFLYKICFSLLQFVYSFFLFQNLIRTLGTYLLNNSFEVFIILLQFYMSIGFLFILLILIGLSICLILTTYYKLFIPDDLTSFKTPILSLYITETLGCSSL